MTTDLQSIEINENEKMCSFDIENVFSNVLKTSYKYNRK